MIHIVGAAAVDLVAVRAEPFRPGTSNPAAIRMATGGVGCRIFRALRAGRRLITALGDDALSGWLEEALRREGEVRVKRAAGRPAPLYLALMAGGRLYCGVSDMRAVEEALDAAFVAECLGEPQEGDFLVLEANLSPRLVAELVGRYAGRMRLVFEAVSVEKAARHSAALRGLALLAANEEEAAALCGAAAVPASPSAPPASSTGATAPTGAADRAIRRYREERGIDTILVGRGARGASLYRGGGRRDFAPGRVVRAADSTGAGDRLLAAVLDGLAAGRPVEEALPPAMRAVEEALEEGSL